MPGDTGFATEPAPDLPGEVVLAAILDYMALSGSTARTVSLARLATEPGSPARAYRLNEEQLADKLSPVAQAHSRDVSVGARRRPSARLERGCR